MAEQIFPEPTVGALVFSKEGKIFLMKSHKFRDKYVIPGGHIELGETMEQALKREVKEETNLKIHGIKFLLMQEFIFNDSFYEKKHFIFLDFQCKTNSIKVKLNYEAQEFIWIEPEKALEMNTEPYTKNAIKEYLKKQKFVEKRFQ